MMPGALQREILLSIPRTAACGDISYEAVVGWADTLNISQELKSHNIVTSVWLSSDVLDDEWTSSDTTSDITYVSAVRTVSRRQYRRTTCTISVHAVSSSPHSAVDIIDSYVTAIQFWSMSALRRIISVADSGSVTDLSYLENGSQRRDMVIFLRYSLEISAAVPSVASIDDPHISMR